MDGLDDKLKKYINVKIKEEKGMSIILVNFKEIDITNKEDEVADLMLVRYGEFLNTPGKVSFIIDCRSIKSVDISLLFRKMPAMIKLNNLAKNKIEASTVVLDPGSGIYKTAKIVEKKFPFAVRGGIFSDRAEALNFINRK